MKYDMYTKKILLSMAVLLLYSCDRKVKSTDIQIVGDDIVYKNQNFTGQVWSKDGKSLVIEVSDGRPVKITLFHENGNPALVSTLFIHDGKVKHYDINGYEMDKGDWLRKYPDIREKRRIMDEEFPIER